MRKSLLFAVTLLALVALGFTFQDARAQGAVTGTVIDADGNPVAGAMVVIRGEMQRRGERPYLNTMQTNDEGGFGFRRVPAGNYMIGAMARGLGGVRQAIEVADGEVTEVGLQLPGAKGGGDQPEVGSVTGRVIDADGNAVAGAKVMMVPADGMRRHRALTARTADDGSFTLDAVPVGRYVIAAMARGLGADRERIAVAADQATDVELQLQPWGDER